MHSSLFIPEQPLSLLDTLEAAGEECWVVGGCVRDSLMGKTPSDWDMTTSATPQPVSYTHLTLPTNSRV